MKKVIALILMAAMALSVMGCQADVPERHPPIGQTQPQESSTPVQWCAQYIRTDGAWDGAAFPGVQLVRSVQDLKDYYTIYHEVYDLERKEQVYADTTIGFLDACDRYDEAFFEARFLLFVLLEESSGSVRHEVRDAAQTCDQKLSISIDRMIPEVGTDDMAQWHIILELDRDVMVESPDDVQVFLDGVLAYDGCVVAVPKPQPRLQTPPAATLHTPEGSALLTAAGYDWTYQNDDATAVATIADQAGRPIPADHLEPVVISSQYAETVYAPIPDGSGYAPTNSLGYLVKLDWEVPPAAVAYTCWQSGNMCEEPVVSHGDNAFYAKPSAFIYEIAATWEGAAYHGTANYYVYIVDSDDIHEHMTALRPQTVADPITGYCGNTQTTLYIGDEEYTFMYGHSVTLTDILVNLNYDPGKVCRCMAQYRADTEFGTGYQIHLDYGFVRCEKGQADLTPEQVRTIAEIIEWAQNAHE